MNTKIVSIVGLILLMSANSWAQKNPNESLDEYNLRRSKNMKEGGVAMIVFGGLLFITGGILEATYYVDSMDSMFSTEPEKKHNNAGPVFICSGLVIAGSGIPLTIVGHRRYKRYKTKPEVISLGINSAEIGFSIKYRF